MPVDTDDIRAAIPTWFPDNVSGDISASDMRSSMAFVADVIDDEVASAVIGMATAAQGTKADSAVQPDDPVSDLNETDTAKIMTGVERQIVSQMEVVGELDGMAVVDENGVLLSSTSPDGLRNENLGPTRLRLGWSRRPLPTITPDGAITDITQSGDWWQVLVDGQLMLIHDAFPDFVPGLLDTTCIDVKLSNGQSWNTQLRLASDLNAEDASGRIARRLVAYRTFDFALARCEVDFSPRIPFNNSIYKTRAYSTDKASGAGGAVLGFRRWAMINSDDFFTMGSIASASRQHYLRDWRQTRFALINLQCGMAGQSEDKFLAPGSSFVGSGAVTVNAAVVSNPDPNDFTMFENDTKALGEVKGIIRNDWFDKQMSVSVETFDQGGAGTLQSLDDNHYLNFLNQHRIDVNSRKYRAADGGLTHILVPQGFAHGSELFQGYHPMDQLRWAQANVSGRDWLVGPFYWLKLLQETAGIGAVHGTAMHNLIKGEMIGLTEAYVLSSRYAFWEPLWITNVVIAGGNVTLTLNNPIASTGEVVIDTTTLPAATSYGFHLRNAITTGNISLGTPVINNPNTMTIPITGSLSGVTSVEFGYATRGVAAAEPAVGGAIRSACIGNIKAIGKHKGLFSEKVLDQWLCNYLKVLSL